MKLITKEKPSENVVGMVRDILRETECVHEALSHTFGGDYKGMDKEYIYLGTYEGVVTDID